MTFTFKGSSCSVPEAPAVRDLGALLFSTSPLQLLIASVRIRSVAAFPCLSHRSPSKLKRVAVNDNNNKQDDVETTRKTVRMCNISQSPNCINLIQLRSMLSKARKLVQTWTQDQLLSCKLLSGRLLVLNLYFFTVHQGMLLSPLFGENKECPRLITRHLYCKWGFLLTEQQP